MVGVLADVGGSEVGIGSPKRDATSASLSCRLPFPGKNGTGQCNYSQKRAWLNVAGNGQWRLDDSKLSQSMRIVDLQTRFGASSLELCWCS